MNKAEILAGGLHIVTMDGKEAILMRHDLRRPGNASGTRFSEAATDEAGRKVWVYLGRTIQSTKLDGIEVDAVAFTRIREHAVKTTTTYRTVNHPIFGEGRRYSDRPGATYYRGERGGFTREIWDAE